jgi:hypothetical protein
MALPLSQDWVIHGMSDGSGVEEYIYPPTYTVVGFWVKSMILPNISYIYFQGWRGASF